MGEISIRKAEEADFDFYYLIRCDEDNLYWTGHASPPLRDSLHDFFSSHIRGRGGSGKRLIFIAEEKCSGRKIGYLYLDPVDGDTAEISVAILQDFSGRGFGRQAVAELCDFAYSRGFTNLYAMVRDDNLRSQRMFRHAGFEKSGTFAQHPNLKVNMIRFAKTR